MSLLFNKSKKKFTEVPDIKVRVPEWGKLESVEFLDTNRLAKALNYMSIGMSDYALPLIEGMTWLGCTAWRDPIC